jgi:flagellar biosynthesis protein FlhA
MPKLSVKAIWQPTVMLAVALMAVIVMMVLPMPSWVLDLGLAGSFALAILIFTITLFIDRPLDFSSFPTVLLASLMLRLSLNVSSTKLIIGEGHTGTDAAGHVIEGFAMFIMGGSLVIGMVLFVVLLIINFLVITKGAGRMAEVSARFALDAMPGKQLAIDSDMAAGAISHEDARERRRIEQEETTFFGSLDGASKFVKGDAIAGLLITVINLAVGLAMGVLVHDMAMGDAFQTYSILTVGDALVNQIPAVITSIAAAMLLSKGGMTGTTDRALMRQLGGYPTALGTVAGLMAFFALIPGLPFFPFVIGAASLGAAAWLASRTISEAKAAAAAPAETEAGPRRKSLGDLLDVDEIHMEFAPDLVPVVMDEATGLDARIVNMRNHIASEYGVILPEIRLTDNPTLPGSGYAIRIQGVEVARAEIETDKVLVLLPEGGIMAPGGRDVAEPVYGAPARWIDAKLQEEAALHGLSVVAPVEVVATHLLEMVKENFGRLFTRRAMRKLLEEFVAPSDAKRAEANRKILEEFVPDKVSVDTLQAVLRLLLEERVSVRNLPLILEAIAEVGVNTSPQAICEHVRHRLGFQLVAGLTEKDGALPLIQLGPDWEETFQKYQLPEGSGVVDVALPPAEFNRLAGAVAEKLNAAGAHGRFPAIVTSTKRRRFLQTVLSAKGIRNPVLSFEEVGTSSKPAVLGLA